MPLAQWLSRAGWHPSQTEREREAQRPDPQRAGHSESSRTVGASGGREAQRQCQITGGWDRAIRGGAGEDAIVRPPLQVDRAAAQSSGVNVYVSLHCGRRTHSFEYVYKSIATSRDLGLSTS